MSVIATSSQQSADELLVKLLKRTKLLCISVSVLAMMLVLTAVVGFFVFDRRVKALDKAQKDLAFSLFITDTGVGEDFVQPSVNTIQFLHRGYSILFEKVEYTQNRLVLSGQIGNPTHLWISSLALTFTARPYTYKIRDKWDKQTYPRGGLTNGTSEPPRQPSAYSIPVQPHPLQSRFRM